MPGPGWYPDPQNSATVRWFDGEQWTEHVAAADPEPAPSVSEPAETLVTAGASGNGGLPGYGEDPYDPYSAVRAAEPVPDAEQTQQLAPIRSTEAAPLTAAAPTAFDAAFNGPPTPAATVAPGRGSHAGRGRAKLDRRLLTIVVAIVAVVAALAAAGLYFFGGSSSRSFTYQGKSISKAAGTLQATESELGAIVSARHGITSSSSTRCYYAVPTNPAGAKTTDIDQYIRCGPVLFVDGNASKPYLSFAFTTAAAGSAVTITPKSAPVSDDPAAAPSGFNLQRPDGKKPPAGSDGLTPPAPPAATANVLGVGVVAVPSGSKTTTAIVGSLTGGITITDIGKVSRFGSGDAARSAPDGQQLYAFKVAAAAGNSGTVTDLSSSTTISVDGGAGRPLPTEPAGQAIVIAVPDATKTLDLVLTDGGIKQTFSLIDAKPGATNLQVLARANRSITVGQTQTATYNYSTKVVFTDKSAGQTQTAAIALAGATLVYRDDVNAVSASGVDKAFLIPDIVYTGSHDGGPYGLDTSLLTFTPTNGAAITAKNISTDPSKIRNVFEVPANVTTGTITVGGSATETFSGGPGTYTLTVAAPISFPITFPAG